MEDTTFPNRHLMIVGASRGPDSSHATLFVLDDDGKQVKQDLLYVMNLEVLLCVKDVTRIRGPLFSCELEQVESLAQIVH